MGLLLARGNLLGQWPDKRKTCDQKCERGYFDYSTSNESQQQID
jgi:hypothetical protein